MLVWLGSDEKDSNCRTGIRAESIWDRLFGLLLFVLSILAIISSSVFIFDTQNFFYLLPPSSDWFN